MIYFILFTDSSEEKVETPSIIPETKIDVESVEGNSAGAVESESQAQCPDPVVEPHPWRIKSYTYEIKDGWISCR